MPRHSPWTLLVQSSPAPALVRDPRIVPDEFSWLQSRIPDSVSRGARSGRAACVTSSARSAKPCRDSRCRPGRGCQVAAHRPPQISSSPRFHSGRYLLKRHMAPRRPAASPARGPRARRRAPQSDRAHVGVNALHELSGAPCGDLLIARAARGSSGTNLGARQLASKPPGAGG